MKVSDQTVTRFFDYVICYSNGQKQINLKEKKNQMNPQLCITNERLSLVISF